MIISDQRKQATHEREVTDMMQVRRCFGVKLLKGGKLQLVGFFSEKERNEYCVIYENHTRPITMKQWKELPKDMKV